jgi:hypothetical protein
MAATTSQNQFPIRTPSKSAHLPISESQSTADVSESGSSDDENGVFFGHLDPLESLLVAKLSVKSTHRRSPLAPLKKRDSREFLRRQTILFSERGNVSEGFERERAWSGGFYEKRAKPRAMGYSSDDGAGTPIFAISKSDTSAVHGEHASNLTFEFSKFCLTDLDTPCRGDEQDSGDGEEFGGSDKENEEIHSLQPARSFTEPPHFTALTASSSFTWVEPHIGSKDTEPLETDLSATAGHGGSSPQRFGRRGNIQRERWRCGTGGPRRGERRRTA